MLAVANNMAGVTKKSQKGKNATFRGARNHFDLTAFHAARQKLESGRTEGASKTSGTRKEHHNNKLIAE